MKLTVETIVTFEKYLCSRDCAVGTREKYLRDVRAFAAFLGGREVTPTELRMWKEQLLSETYMAVTVNSMLSAVHALLHFLGRDDCRTQYLRVQRRVFSDPKRELTRAEFDRLVAAADQAGKERLARLLETICATGIRVSEVKYITVEAIRQGRAQVFLKGKVRTILLPTKLRKKLAAYAKKKKIVSGEIFLSRDGRSLSRRRIWTEMKGLCKAAKVESSKVFPHNLRHLFACTFYKICKDIVRLADILGHSSIDTTRIYLCTSGTEHIRELERLRLVT